MRMFDKANGMTGFGRFVGPVRLAEEAPLAIDADAASVTMGTEEDDILYGDDGDNELHGLGGDDDLMGVEGNDILVGGAGDDMLWGGPGDDILDGGPGDDLLSGGSGSDTYRFDPGWGDDAILDPYWWWGDEAGKTDVILFGTGVEVADITVHRKWNDLLLRHANGIDQIRVSGYFFVDQYPIDEVRFADGTVWDPAAIQSMVTQITDGDDFIVGTDGDDLLEGLGGDDVILGGYGDDVLVGGPGDDFLDGGPGSDTYRFDPGWGRDEIAGQGWELAPAPKTDVIQFGDGISETEITASRIYDDLVLRHANGVDQIRVSGHFSAEQPRIDEVRFADGTVWDAATIQEMVKQATDWDDYLVGGDGDDILEGLGGDDVLLGGKGDDILVGGPGDDLLDGGPGADIYRFDPGWGRDLIVDHEPWWSSLASGPDAIEFGIGVAPGDIAVRRHFDDLFLRHANGVDQIRIVDHFAQNPPFVEEIRFADGTVWNGATIEALVTQGTDGDDFLVGGDGDDLLEGLGGNDVILGGDGDDILVGGPGNDVLYGGLGSDTFRFDAGWGQDFIVDEMYWPAEPAGKMDAILFGPGIAATDISARREGDDLVIRHVNGVDQITVIEHFVALEPVIDEIRFADGTVWNAATIQAMVTQGTDGDDFLVGSDGDDLLEGLGGHDIILGGEGDDILDGGPGDDFLDGGPGFNTYRFDPGWGRDTVANEQPWWMEPSPRTDVIAFGAGIGTADIDVRNEDGDLVLSHLNGVDTITYLEHFLRPDRGLNEVRFADGAVWDAETLFALSMRGTGENFQLGTPSGDNLAGGPSDDILHGLAGDDILDGSEGDDQLYGGQGADTLIGGAGNDRLDGGSSPAAAANFLFGGQGDDTYIVRQASDIVDEGFLYPEHVGLPTDVDTIISHAEFWWDYYAVGERHVIAEDNPHQLSALIGSLFDSEMIGNDGWNILFTVGGNNIVRPGGGADYIALGNIEGYRGVDTVVLEPSTSYGLSWTAIWDFMPGEDIIDLSAFGFSSFEEMAANGHDDGTGTSYYLLDGWWEVLFLVGLEKADVSAGDFIV